MIISARGAMWMGPRGYESWVPACAISPDFSRKGFAQGTSYLNGGAFVQYSKASGRSYAMSWGPRPQTDMRYITDIQMGLYDTQNGVNLVYFLDPMTLQTNVAPQHLGNPAVAGEGGPSLFGWDNTPTLVQTDANQYGYPARSALWATTNQSQTTYIPIPPNFTAWIGAHGIVSGGASVRVTPAMGTTDGTPTALTMLGVNTPTLMNYSIQNANGVTGFTIDSPAVTGGKLQLAGIIVQILPTGQQPPTGRYISGQGNSGCTFAGPPTETPYNAKIDDGSGGQGLMAMTATLVETGAWL